MKRVIHFWVEAAVVIAAVVLTGLGQVHACSPAGSSCVVGTGTPSSCTESALDPALEGGGSVTFDCGPSAVTVTITATKTIETDTTIDGGGLVTLSGGNAVAVLNVQGVTLSVENLTITGGND